MFSSVHISIYMIKVICRISGSLILIVDYSIMDIFYIGQVNAFSISEYYRKVGFFPI